jgi:hypothetical protein
MFEAAFRKLRSEAIRLFCNRSFSHEHPNTQDLAAASTHDRRHDATRVAEEVFFLVAQSHDDDCRRTCSERGSADLMFSHQKPTGYGGFRKEPSKAPGQCTPAQAAVSFREERFWILPATGG